jgi:hypothetical protein
MGFLSEKCNQKGKVITDLLSFIDKTIINEDDVKEFARFYN